MKISTKGRYALRIMIDLALHDEGSFIPLKSIAERQDITVKYLEQIITLLQRAGFVKSLRGNSGGYKLSKPAKEYTVGDVLRITEGSLTPVGCLDDAINQCPRSCKCATLTFWEGLQKLINDYVDGVTIFDLMSAKVDGENNFCI